MDRSVKTSDWYSFLNNLSHLLQMSIGVIKPGGCPAKLFDRQTIFKQLEQNKCLNEAYRIFFSQVSNLNINERRIVFDPLGLPAAVARSTNGHTIIISGCFNKEDPQQYATFEELVKSFGLDGTKNFWRNLYATSLDELSEIAASLESIMYLTSNFLQKSEDLDNLSLLLKAIDEINKFIVLSFSTEHFNPERILDLVVSSIQIFTRSEGAFVSIRHLSGYGTSSLCGNYGQFMQTLISTWQLQAKERPGSPPTVEELPLEQKGNLRLESTIQKAEDWLLLIGVLNPQSGQIQPVLCACTKLINICMEIYAMFSVLKNKIGSLLNSITQGVFITNKDGLVIMCNRSAQRILAPCNIHLKPGLVVSECGFPQAIVEAILTVSASGNSYTQKRIAIGNEDSPVHLRWHVTPIMQINDEIAGAVFLFEDITEPVELFMEMQERERLATAVQVAAGLAHEIRNPLATAKAALELFHLIDNADKQKELLDKLSSELDRMNEILTNFLNISRPVKPEALKPVSLVQAVNELRYLLKSETHLHDIDLTITYPASRMPPVLGNLNSLKQVFLNLSRNAIEAMTEGGKLKIALGANDSEAWVIFSDTGHGIPPENIKLITRPFFTTKLSGTGLGLSVSSSIIKEMGGNLTIESEPGKGTTIRVAMPICEMKVQENTERYTEGCNSKFVS